jgi:hypothetical protein
MTTTIIHVLNGNFNMYKTALFYNAQLTRALVLNGPNAQETGGIRMAHTQ